MESKQTNPIQDLFGDIKKILDFMEVKDQNQAMEYETIEMRNNADMWMHAIQEKDNYLTYAQYWNHAMFQEIVSNVKFNDIRRWMKTPHTVPLRFRDNLLKRGREAFLSQYEEANTYYRMLNGLPPLDTPKSEFIYLSDELKDELNAHDDIPVHRLSTIVQNRYMSTEEYQRVLHDNPDKSYLKYLGIFKIDTFTARKARDYELIRYLPMDRSDINPNLLREFGALYTDYREYVMSVLYNRNFENLYENYRTFMGFLIQSFVLMQICNKAVESVHDRRFLDDNVLYIILSMYDIPRSLLMTKEVRRNLVINLLKLTREKSTDDVYYDLVQILGYQDIVISKLMLMRGQKFSENGQTSFSDQSPLNDFEDIDSLIKTNSSKKNLDVAPYFVGVDIKDKNPYDTISSGEAPIYSYEEITGPDPTWWDYEDTQNLLKNTNYTVADSKYIMVEAVIHQIEFMFESIYFTRLILDNKKYTDTFDINIPEIFGTDTVSIYDLMVFIVAATCMNYGLTGDITTTDNGMFATAGFNFDIDLVLFQEFLDTTQYVDKDKIMTFLENISMKDQSDINRLFNEVMYPMREWLQEKIAQSTERYEFIEYESVYRSLFTYDAAKNSFLGDFEMPIETIRKQQALTENEMQMYKHFYPRTYTGEAVTEDNFHQSRYYPFNATWNIDIPYKGRLYFHDILNSSDIRYIKIKDGEDKAGEYLFMDVYDDGNGNQTLELDRDALNDALNRIGGLADDELRLAEIKIETPILGTSGKYYAAGERLPASIRNGSFKQILIDKILMDVDGLAVPPKTYKEYLFRKNNNLYEILVGNDRFEYEKEAWLDDVMTIVLAVETELNMHLKYFEQSVVGSDLFFKPLITLIKHFKSTFVNFAKTGLSYVFGDKIDTGGNSNMFKLFDYMSTTIHFVLLSKRAEDSQFGLYDAEHMVEHSIIVNDRDGVFNTKRGSIRMEDEMKFFLNGEDNDPNGHASAFYPGEFGTGLYTNDQDFITKTRTGTDRVSNFSVDTEAWKDHVESYNPQ